MTTGGKKAQQRQARKAAMEAKRKRKRNLWIGGIAVVVVGVIAFVATRPEPAAASD